MSPCEEGIPRLTASTLHVLLCGQPLSWLQRCTGSENTLNSCYIFSMWCSCIYSAVAAFISYCVMMLQQSRCLLPPMELDKHGVLLLCVYECCMPKQPHSSLFCKWPPKNISSTVWHACKQKHQINTESVSNTVANKLCRTHQNMLWVKMNL